MKRPSLLDPDFKYIPASRSNIALTFARIRKQMKEAEAAKPSADKVRVLRRREQKGSK